MHPSCEVSAHGALWLAGSHVAAAEPVDGNDGKTAVNLTLDSPGTRATRETAACCLLSAAQMQKPAQVTDVWKGSGLGELWRCGRLEGKGAQQSSGWTED